jgi:hypothetical protein
MCLSYWCQAPLIPFLGRETFFIGKDGLVKDVCDKMVDWK